MRCKRGVKWAGPRAPWSRSRRGSRPPTPSAPGYPPPALTTGGQTLTSGQTGRPRRPSAPGYAKPALTTGQGPPSANFDQRSNSSTRFAFPAGEGAGRTAEGAWRAVQLGRPQPTAKWVSKALNSVEDSEGCSAETLRRSFKRWLTLRRSFKRWNSVGVSKRVARSLWGQGPSKRGLRPARGCSGRPRSFKV